MNKDGCKGDIVVEPETKLKIENTVLITRHMGGFSCYITAKLLEVPLEQL